MRERSAGDCGSWYRFAMARTKAANPAAELAKPAAVGKLFSDTMRSGRAESFGREESVDSRVWRRERR
jgi:hypothetical protein